MVRVGSIAQNHSCLIVPFEAPAHRIVVIANERPERLERPQPRLTDIGYAGACCGSAPLAVPITSRDGGTEFLRQESQMKYRNVLFLGAMALALAITTRTSAAEGTGSAAAAAPQAATLSCVNKAAEAAKPKVVFQVNKADEAPLILRFVGNYLKAEPDAEVVVVGYASGIDFMLKNALDADGKPYAVQVNRLIDRGVTFKVCNNTLSARNATPDVVLAGVAVVPSAVNEIIRLQTQEGYSYFRN